MVEVVRYKNISTLVDHYKTSMNFVWQLKYRQDCELKLMLQ